MRRVAQPPINPLVRDPEVHYFWPGFIGVLIATALLFIGAGHVTGLDTTDGESARETQLVKSFTSGGLQLVGPAPPPDPASFEDPAEAVAALERLAQEEATAPIKYRVNTGAADPCPT